jgi:hypothetical protein
VPLGCSGPARGSPVLHPQFLHQEVAPAGKKLICRITAFIYHRHAFVFAPSPSRNGNFI